MTPRFPFGLIEGGCPALSHGAGTPAREHIPAAPGTPLGFVLFPMIHLATPAFYADVMTRLAGCQLIVAEGGLGAERTAGGQALTLSYRLAGRARR